MPKTFQGRRSFLSMLTAIAGAAAVPGAPGAAAAEQAPAGEQWGLGWMDELKAAAHRQVFDMADTDPAATPPPLRLPRNYLDGFRDVYRLAHPQVRTIVGITARSFGVNCSDRLWEKYALGERGNIIDRATGKPAVRNIFMDDPTLGVKALQARGTVFWQCAIALDTIAGQLAQSRNLPVADVRADLIAGLNPGVRLVPSHVMALGLVQERGATYVKI
jgi:hypothetical protein